MRYVILRDDDTNVLTPPECLERLYRPFLDAGLAVNVATIPCVCSDAKRPDGGPEAFLWRANMRGADCYPLSGESALTNYVRANPGYHIVQHGLHHKPFEFDSGNRAEVADRLESGRRLLKQAGFSNCETFVAPHDKFSRASYREVAQRFRVISSGWFELRRLPHAWWPRYGWARARGWPHWRVNGTVLLSHPGCLLSYMSPYDSMLETIKAHIQQHQLTVLVTHWWEYFREGEPDNPFIAVLHSLAEYLQQQAELKVISFSELARANVPLN